MTLNKIDSETLEEVTEIKQTYSRKRLEAERARYSVLIKSIDAKLALLK